MAKFPKIQLTRLGKNMIMDGQNKKPVAFTKVELGDGLLSGQSVEELTALVHSVMSVPLQNFTNNGDGTAHLRFVLDNNDLDKGFFNREIGVYAKVGDGTEQLYAYTNAANLADYIPGKESPITSKIINLHLIIGNTANISIVAENSAYATKIDIEKHRTASELDHPDGSVTTPKLRDAAVTGEKIANKAIGKEHLKDGVVDDKAPIASPALTGTPTVPTATKGTSTDQIASTAFVSQAITDAVLAIGGHETPTITALINWELMATENNGVDARNLQNSESGVIACGGDNASKSGYGKGCILLKQVYTDFDKILVLGCDDACSFCTRRVFDKWELDLMFANSLTFNIINDNGIVWRIFGGKKGTYAGELSSGKVWRTHSQGCGIIEIYGIKY
jgi:hypothetical protein